VLPSRSRLQGWNPESLSSSAATISSAGDTIYTAVRTLDDDIDRMPESRGWSGQAHDAATDMFTRATDRSSSFKDYAAAVATALHSGSKSIGAARTALLKKAIEVDSGPLNVTDQWVVLIDPAGMSAERAAQLEADAKAAQAEINEMAIAVDDADAATSMALVLARATKGADFENLVAGPPSPVPPVPVDDVPDPRTEEGRQFQEIARGQDMATTIREITESRDELGNLITTYTMIDGSTQVTTEYEDGLPSEMLYRPGTVKVVNTDKNGNFVSETMTHPPREDGSQMTEVWWGDGTHMTISSTADGQRTASVTTPDGRHGVLPDQFFTDPWPTLAGGALSGVEVTAGKPVPGVGTQMLDDIRVGAKFGGPALGLAMMAYNAYSAETVHDACVATYSGTTGLVGGIATTVVAGAIPGAGPIAAMGANIAGTWVFGYVGAMIGEVACPP
jgi:hypothetical protein